MNNKALIVIIVAVVILGGAVLFFNRAQMPVSQPMGTEEHANTNTPPAEEAVPNATTSNEAVASETKEFTVTGSSFAFAPSSIEVNQGDRVKIIFKNSGGFHDWKIDEFNVATKRIKAGEQDVVEFTADKAGTFEYYCSVGTHRAMGMKGTLTVK